MEFLGIIAGVCAIAVLLCGAVQIFFYLKFHLNYHVYREQEGLDWTQLVPPAVKKIKDFSARLLKVAALALVTMFMIQTKPDALSGGICYGACYIIYELCRFLKRKFKKNRK